MNYYSDGANAKELLEKIRNGQDNKKETFDSIAGTLERMSNTIMQMADIIIKGVNLMHPTWLEWQMKARDTLTGYIREDGPTVFKLDYALDYADEYGLLTPEMLKIAFFTPHTPPKEICDLFVAICKKLQEKKDNAIRKYDKIAADYKKLRGANENLGGE